MYDIVIPNKNEREFVDMAKKLGFKGLIFIVDKVPKKKFDTKFPHKYVTKKDFVKTTSKVRHTIEKVKPKLIYGIEYHNEKDYMKQKNSQLNQIIAKIMKKNKVSYGISISELFGKDLVKVLPRILQNIMLCKKYKVNIVVGSFATSPYEMNNMKDVIGCMKILGMDVKNARKFGN